VKILVTQPYVPAYRVPLFSEVARILTSEGHEFVVASGRAHGTQALRGDQATADWSHHFTTSTISIGSRRIEHRKMPIAAGGADLVVSELEALNTFAWRRSLESRTSLVLWGHGKPYVNDSTWLADRLEWALARRSTHLMTYTDGGRNFLVDQGGIDSSKVTAIGNSTDTKALRTAMANLSDESRMSIRSEVGQGMRALFVGGLDASKRIDFLIEAAKAARNSHPDFKLILVGRGELDDFVKAKIAGGAPLIQFPDARNERLVQVASSASMIWMPGRVGLVAVDAVALGLPLHTTNFRYHAPELELLRDDEVAYLPNDPTAFADASLRQALASPDGLALRANIPSVESVAQNFANVVLSNLPPRVAT
jgi:hypothetical protein